MNPYLIGALGWGGYDPLSFLKIASEAQLIATIKYGAMVGAAEFIALGILFRLVVLRHMLGMEVMISDRTKAAADLVIIGPLREETIFRLGGITAVYALTGSLLGGVALSSVAFGLGHLYQGPGNALVHVIGGLILAYAFLTGGLLAAIVAHATYNLIIASFLL